MALPNGFERPIGAIQILRPKGSAHLIVDRQHLKIPFYKIELVSDSFGKPDRRVNHVEIHPIGWDALIVFAALKTKIPPVGIPVTNIADV